MAKPSVQAQLALTADSERVFYTAGTLARQHLCYVQEAGHFKALPGYFTERSGLPSFLLVYTLRGRGLLRYDGRECEVRSGQFFLIDCRHYQYYRQQGDEKWEFYWLHFYGGASAAYWQAICETAPGKPGEPQAYADEATFSDPIRQLIKLCAKPGLQTDMLAARLINGLLTTVLLVAGGLQERPPEHSPAVQQILEIFQKELYKNWTMADLSRQVSLNKQYLMRLFRRETGQTPLEYRQALRIGQAKTLLRTTALNIQEIAEQTGFESGNYFIRVFKKMEAMTPLAYRKKWTDSDNSE